MCRSDGYKPLVTETDCHNCHKRFVTAGHGAPRNPSVSCPVARLTTHDARWVAAPMSRASLFSAPAFSLSLPPSYTLTPLHFHAPFIHRTPQAHRAVLSPLFARMAAAHDAPPTPRLLLRFALQSVVVAAHRGARHRSPLACAAPTRWCPRYAMACVLLARAPCCPSLPP